MGLAVIDTKKSAWVPQPGPAAVRRGLASEDLQAALAELDDPTLSRAERGELYRLLNENVGAWFSPTGEARVLRWSRQR